LKLYPIVYTRNDILTMVTHEIEKLSSLNEWVDCCLITYIEAVKHNVT